MTNAEKAIIAQCVHEVAAEIAEAAKALVEFYVAETEAAKQAATEQLQTPKRPLTFGAAKDKEREDATH